MIYGNSRSRTCAAWPFCGTTPPSQKIIQAGENVNVDFHPCYRGYLSDLGHNLFIGEMTADQRKLADAFGDAAHVRVDAMKVGSTVRDVCRAVTACLEKSGYLPHAIPMYGHGLGMIGNEWYAAVVDNEEFGPVVLEENVVEVAFLCITIPGVAGIPHGMPGPRYAPRRRDAEQYATATQRAAARLARY